MRGIQGAPQMLLASEGRTNDECSLSKSDHLCSLCSGVCKAFSTTQALVRTFSDAAPFIPLCVLSVRVSVFAFARALALVRQSMHTSANSSAYTARFAPVLQSPVHAPILSDNHVCAAKIRTTQIPSPSRLSLLFLTSRSFVTSRKKLSP